MKNKPLAGQSVLITGSARRIGRLLALTAAQSGANIILHHSASPSEAINTAREIEMIGSRVTIISADFSNPQQAASLIDEVWRSHPFNILVNNAAIFESLDWRTTTLQDWKRHQDINLTVPFLLCQAFAKRLPETEFGKIINILDWRALRPGADHLPYTISKAGLAALTKSLAVSFAPHITVNGLALGAILPPSDGGPTEEIPKHVPAERWASEKDVQESFIFLLTAPTYITGEIIHLDGGRHLI